MRGLLISDKFSHKGNGYRWVSIKASKPVKLPKQIVEKEFRVNGAQGLFE